MAKKSHKGQHFVPASYLKAWCDPACPPEYEPYVWVFDKDGSNARKRAPANIFKETDLYTIKKADGTRDLRLEHGLAGLEGRFVKILRDRISKQRKLNAEDRVYLAAFVATAQVRTTQSRDHHASQWGNVLKVADDLAEAMAKATPEQRRASTPKVLSGGGPSLSHEQVRQLAKEPLLHLIPVILSRATPILAQMDMAIFQTDDPIGFMTTDNPCCWFDPEAYKRAPMYQGVGLGLPTVEVTMPLSPSQCLLLNWRGLNGYMPLKGSLVDELNLRHRHHAEDHFVLNANARKEEWFVERPMPEDAWEKLRRNAQETDKS